jgi:hypothetical protein
LKVIPPSLKQRKGKLVTPQNGTSQVECIVIPLKKGISSSSSKKYVFFDFLNPEGATL